MHGLVTLLPGLYIEDDLLGTSATGDSRVISRSISQIGVGIVVEGATRTDDLDRRDNQLQLGRGADRKKTNNTHIRICICGYT